eukprot:c15749_g1_i1.p1 GENE.c15749_g1_i1~~c15749_g1_i1.p1  ORF type:complete len:282 (-),score=103.34 c15749_g1_i1:147-992(-)
MSDTNNSNRGSESLNNMDDKSKLRLVARECKKLQQDLVAAHEQIQEEKNKVSQLTQELEEEKKKRQEAEQQYKSSAAVENTTVLQAKIQSLERDRDTYKQETIRLTTENQNLKELFSAMEESMEQMKKQIEELTLKLNEANSIPAQQRSERQFKEDSLFREAFSLNDDQYIICRYPCSYGTLICHGDLFIAPLCVCFAQTLTKENNNSVILYYHDISSVERISRFSIGIKLGKAIEFTMKDGKTHVFLNFSRRDTVLRDIYNQAKIFSLPWAASVDLTQKD